MEQLNNKKILNITSICILVIVPFLKFFSMNLEMFKVINNYDFINPAIVLYISVSILLFIYIKDIVNTKRKLDIYDYIFYLLVITGIISTIFSIDKELSIFGKPFRHEGLLSLLSYYLLFINYKVNGSKQDVNRFTKLILIIGIINSLYALLQIYANYDFILRYTDYPDMASGMCGNPNFFGSLIVTCLGIMMCKIIINKKILFKDILITILLFISLINSQSTGPFITLILTLIFLIVFLSIKRKIFIRNTIILILILIGTYYSVQYNNMRTYKIERCEMCSSGVKQTIETGGNGRLKIWENSLKIVKDNFIVGVGFDNFYLAYPNPKIDNSVSIIATNNTVKMTKKSYYIVDTAHNIYLHILVSNGIIGLTPYLILLLLVFIKAIKSKDNLLLIIFSGFIAYSIQAFGNISVIQVAPIYYILIGLILSDNNNQIKTLT